MVGKRPGTLSGTLNLLQLQRLEPGHPAESQPAQKMCGDPQGPCDCMVYKIIFYIEMFHNFERIIYQQQLIC